MNLCVIACVHGNELFGLEVIKMLKGSRIKTIIANNKAVKVKKRFIDKDLNRSFPGNKHSIHYEERRAHELMNEIKCNKVIDLHSSTSNTPPFAIITKTSPEVISLAMSTGIKRICLMNPEIANGKSLIDNVKAGVSLEMGRHDDQSLPEKTYKLIMNTLKEKQKTNHEFYKIIGVEHNMNVEAENFKFNGEYYPILVGEASYKGIKCLKAQRVNTLI